LKNLISILIPTFERPDYLRRSLAQIAAQKFRDFEVIITDDSVSEIIEQFVRSQTFSFPLHYRRNRPALGTPRNWTAGLDMASGEWIKILHDDDWLSHSDSLAEFARAIRPDIDLIFGGYEAVFEQTGKREDRTISVRQFNQVARHPHRLFISNLLGPPSVLLYRRSVKETFDPALKWIVDWEGYIRMLQTHRAAYIDRAVVSMSYNSTQVTQACFGNPAIEIPEALVYYHRHGDQTRSTWMMYDVWWRLIRNLSIRSVVEVDRFANGAKVPFFLYRIIAHQRWLPLRWWKIGLLSKIGMFLSFKLNR
jgi:glycosyltransferase involved in cell wall biosynthesis